MVRVFNGGKVTIPKQLRDRFDVGHSEKVEATTTSFLVVYGADFGYLCFFNAKNKRKLACCPESSL